MADYLGALEESPQDGNRNPIDRVERTLNQMKSILAKPPQFLLCILLERKNSDLYGDFIISCVKE